jgi:hypothetical protein
MPLCPPRIPNTTGRIAHPILRDDRPATEGLNHGPACDVLCRYTNSWRNMTKCWQQTPNNVKSIWHCLDGKERKVVKSVRLSFWPILTGRNFASRCSNYSLRVRQFRLLATLTYNKVHVAEERKWINTLQIS